MPKGPLKNKFSPRINDRSYAKSRFGKALLREWRDRRSEMRNARHGCDWFLRPSVI